VARRENSGELDHSEEVEMMMFNEMIIDGVCSMEPKEWEQFLQAYRHTQIETLRAINRKEITVTELQRAEIEKAARGLWAWSNRLDS
jgi:sialic acid synthase SpsE